MTETTFQPPPPIRRNTIPAVALVLLVVAVGSRIPLPGLDLQDLDLHLQQSTGISPYRFSVLALGIMPLFTVLAHAEILRLMVPQFVRWEAACARNAQWVNRIVIALALVFAALQGWGILDALQQAGMARPDAVAFTTVGVATLVAGTATLIWLGRLVPLPGLGSAFWLLLVLPFLTELPLDAAAWIELVRTGAVSPLEPVLLGAYLIASIALIVFVQSALLSVLQGQNVPATLASDMLIWPSFLPGIALGYLVIPIALMSSDPDGVINALQVAIPILNVILIPLFVYAYARVYLLKRIQSDDAKALMRVLSAVAGAQVVIFAVGSILFRTLQLPLSLSTSMLVVLAVTMVSLIPLPRTSAVPNPA